MAQGYSDWKKNGTVSQGNGSNGAQSYNGNKQNASNGLQSYEQYRQTAQQTTKPASLVLNQYERNQLAQQQQAQQQEAAYQSYLAQYNASVDSAKTAMDTARAGTNWL